MAAIEIDPESTFWFLCSPKDVERELYSVAETVLAFESEQKCQECLNGLQFRYPNKKFNFVPEKQVVERLQQNFSGNWKTIRLSLGNTSMDIPVVKIYQEQQSGYPLAPEDAKADAKVTRMVTAPKPPVNNTDHPRRGGPMNQGDETLGSYFLICQSTRNGGQAYLGSNGLLLAFSSCQNADNFFKKLEEQAGKTNGTSRSIQEPPKREVTIGELFNGTHGDWRQIAIDPRHIGTKGSNGSTVHRITSEDVICLDLLARGGGPTQPDDGKTRIASMAP